MALGERLPVSDLSLSRRSSSAHPPARSWKTGASGRPAIIGPSFTAGIVKTAGRKLAGIRSAVTEEGYGVQRISERTGATCHAALPTRAEVRAMDISLAKNTAGTALRAHEQPRPRYRMVMGTALSAVAAGNAAVIVWLWLYGGGVSGVRGVGDLLTSLGRITGLLSAYSRADPGAAAGPAALAGAAGRLRPAHRLAPAQRQGLPATWCWRTWCSSLSATRRWTSIAIPAEISRVAQQLSRDDRGHRRHRADGRGGGHLAGDRAPAAALRGVVRRPPARLCGALRWPGSTRYPPATSSPPT